MSRPLITRVPTCKPPPNSGSLIPENTRHPLPSLDSVTGLPVGARIFRHPDAYPMLSGKDMGYLLEFNYHFPVLLVRFERATDRSLLVWVDSGLIISCTYSPLSSLQSQTNRSSRITSWYGGDIFQEWRIFTSGMYREHCHLGCTDFYSNPDYDVEDML